MSENSNSPGDVGEQEYRGLKIHAAPSLHEACMAQVKALGLPAGAKALDVGAGEGAFTQRLLDAGLQVSAIELDRDRFRLDVPCQNLNLNLDFHDKWDEKFALIVAMEILEHLYDPRHFIRNCLQLLEPNGFLLISSPNTESWLSRIRFLRDGNFLWFEESDYKLYGHVTPIFSWQIRQICDEFGAELVQVTNTDDEFLRKRLGQSVKDILTNKAFYLRALYPLMKGRKDGEISIYLIRQAASNDAGGTRDHNASLR
jgi:SAM-dependent methyltransferase